MGFGDDNRRQVSICFGEVTERQCNRVKQDDQSD